MFLPLKCRKPHLNIFIIVTAGKDVVFGGFLGVYGKTIGQINFKLDIYQGGRDL